jgi:hypothetical protein
MPGGEKLPLQGQYIDYTPSERANYFINLYSDMPFPINQNISENSETVRFEKSIFAKMQVPGLRESSNLRKQMISNYYG